jgi:sensor histidine kinase YesM
VNGICIVWFYHIEEKQYIDEKRIIDERTRKAFYEKKVVESRLRLLQAQIEPHFLFNTLTSILSLSDKDPQKAKKMQADFIQYLKATLTKTRASITTIAQEIDLVRSYLAIFKVRMGKRLHYKVDVDDEILDSHFPSMLIQPVVENSIKHGLEPKIEGGEITVRAFKAGEKIIRWEIADTGLGVSDTAGLGTGLSSVMERMEALYGSDGRFILEDNHPAGLRVVLEVLHA